MATIGTWLALASALPLAALGVFLLRVKPSKPDQSFLGCALVLWGIQIALANVGVAADSFEVHRVTYLLSLVMMLPLTIFMVHFASLAWQSTVLRWLTWATMVVGVFASVVFATSPTSIASVVLLEGLPTAYIGILAVPLVFLPLQAGFVLAAASGYRRLRTEQDGLRRDRAMWLVAALVVYPSYQSARQGFAFRGSITTGLAGPLLQAMFLASVVVLLVIVVDALWRRASWTPFVVASVVLPWLSVAVEIPLSVSLVGLWRIVAAALLTYALVRFRLFDIDLRVKKGIARTALAGVFVAAFFVAEQIGQSMISERVGPYVGLAGAALLTIALAPIKRATDRIAQRAMPGVEPTPDYLASRRLLVYRAAFDSAMRDGEMTPRERATLERIREELGISEAEARGLEGARAAVT